MSTNTQSQTVWSYGLLIFACCFCCLGLQGISVAQETESFNAESADSAERSDSVDYVGQLQEQAIKNGRSPAAHWGWRPEVYTLWGTHSNRLVPVYTFGTKNAGKEIDLDYYQGENSLYRDEKSVTRLYGRLTTRTVNPNAEYLDQTNIFDIQRAALAAGKKHIFLVVFDGMDWETTRAAAIYNEGKISYESGRGTGTHFQEYMAGGTSQFGFMVTSPHNEGTRTDVNSQSVTNPGGSVPGGYDVKSGGPNPWTAGNDDQYLVSKSEDPDSKHAYTDSACSATSMTAGIKSYNGAINVTPNGDRIPTIAHMAQMEGYSVGTVSNVPISHATPAAAYAHNVSRNDYQDLTRDMLGLPSISHPKRPLQGLDVAIGGGFGNDRDKDSGQGDNFVAGNSYLTAADMKKVNVENGGKYVVAVRSEGVSGGKRLSEAAAEAAKNSKRLLGFFGIGSNGGHLPYQTADGKYDPVIGRSKTAEEYTEGDLKENPTLAVMTGAAIVVLETNKKGFWLLVEAGDVDWANHDNNLDNSIGAVNSGDDAVKVITDWVEKNSNWDESVVIVTADHGHYLFLDKPEMLINK